MNFGGAFQRGRDARREGKDRACPDGRMTPETRAKWYAGWDLEDSFRAAKMTDEKRREVLAGWDRVKEAVSSVK